MKSKSKSALNWYQESTFSKIFRILIHLDTLLVLSPPPHKTLTLSVAVLVVKLLCWQTTSWFDLQQGLCVKFSTAQVSSIRQGCVCPVDCPTRYSTDVLQQGWVCVKFSTAHCVFVCVCVSSSPLHRCDDQHCLHWTSNSTSYLHQSEDPYFEVQALKLQNSS